MKHVILDYDVGNLASIQNACSRVGLDTIISKDPNVIKEAISLILPGVGAFEDAMSSLESSGLIPLIKEHIAQNKYLLGICLGMQLLYTTSYEFGVHQGLDIIKGDIKRFDIKEKIPHMGWNSIRFNKPNDPILQHISEGDYVYFVHSYYVSSNNQETIASTFYGVDVPAIVKQNNVYATQFHPEKSGSVGLKILKAYGELIR